MSKEVWEADIVVDGCRLLPEHGPVEAWGPRYRCAVHAADNWQVGVALGAKPRCCVDTVEMAYGDIRKAAAATVDDPIWLHWLAQSPTPQVRIAVARSAHVSAHTLDLLILDANIAVRVAAAGSARLSSRGRRIANNTAEIQVRLALLGHPTADDAMERLVRDPVLQVRARAAQVVGASGTRTWRHHFSLLAQDHKEVRTALAANTAIWAHPPVVQTLMDDQSAHVRMQLASNSQAPAKWLTRLAGDEVDDVRFCVAGHANTPIAILRRLAQDPSPMVRSAAGRSLAAVA